MSHACALARRVLTILVAAAFATAHVSAHAQSPPNAAPLMVGSPPLSVPARSYYTFRPWVRDPDGDRLYFSIAGKPPWAQFNTVAGRLTGTPKEIGEWTNIRISVSDGRHAVRLRPFTLRVRPQNSAPSIRGLPILTASSGSYYQFTPQASDADDDILVYGIANKPAWATFDAASGRLSGRVPGSAPSSFGGIGIQVSDGYARASLPAFAITVLPSTPGSAVLSWSQPTANTDGSVVRNLSGYVIHYGTDIDCLYRSVAIANPSVTSHVLENLPAATYYFAVRALTIAGAQSGLSNIGARIVE